MRFQVDQRLFDRVRPIFERYSRLYWIVGGAGSGKSTICRALSQMTGIPIYDMDAHIYGDYHTRFAPDRHPVNWAWATADNGLGWLLNLSWEEFDSFNRAALPEYLDLLAADLQIIDPGGGFLVDGGISTPALLAQVMPVQQIVCIARPQRSSVEIWQESADRLAMKGFVEQLPNRERAWQRFLEFDARITETILGESRQEGISICIRHEADEVEPLARRIAAALSLC